MLSISEAAKRLGVHHMKVYWWCKRKFLPAVKVGRDYRIREEDLVEWENEIKVERSNL